MSAQIQGFWLGASAPLGMGCSLYSFLLVSGVFIVGVGEGGGGPMFVEGEGWGWVL